MKLRRTTTGLGTEYRTLDGAWRVWQEPYPPRRWFVNSVVDADATEFAEGFCTLHEARGWLEKRLTPPRREHRWGGAGYVCNDCGAIKDAPASGSDDECPGPTED